MLTCESKKLIKKLTEFAKNDGTLVTFSESEQCFYFNFNNDGKCDCPFLKHGIINVLYFLEEQGYILFHKEKKHIFTLTHKAFHIYEIKWREFGNFLFKSFLVPIIVAIITSFLYNYLFNK